MPRRPALLPRAFVPTTAAVKGRRGTARVLAVLVGIAGVVAVGGHTASAALPSLHVDFKADDGTPPAAGYTADIGAAYTATAGTGWVDQSTGVPLSLVGNGRNRSSSPSPAKTDTLIQMQETPASTTGTLTPGRWEAAIANGTYTVTVGVGDSTAYNSDYVINAERGTANAVTLVNHVVPTAAQPFATGTKTVTVSDGNLTIDAIGGTNTKITYLDVVPAPLSVSTPDDATLHLAGHRLVFSKVATGPAAAAKSVTFTNSTSSAMTISGIGVTGTDAAQFQLAAGQGSTLTVAANSTASLPLSFAPTTPTDCPTTPPDEPNMVRSATLSYTAAGVTSTVGLGGIVSCAAGGSNEPVLDALVQALGYSTVVDPTTFSPGTSRRILGPARHLAGSDEVTSPFFVAADASKPVSLQPLAHYSGPDTTGTAQTSGWYPMGVDPRGSSTHNCTSSNCHVLWHFAPDVASGSSYLYPANQMALPAPTGTTTFTPSGAFGLFNGQDSNNVYSDDGLNVGTTATGVALSPPHYLHTDRIYPAFGPGHVQIPHTYLVTIDITHIPADKNNDFQDVVDVLSNADPAVPTAPTTASHDLTAAGGTVSSSCAVTGFDGVLANTGGTQCAAAHLAFGSTGLKITSDTGQLANGDQKNALYDSMNAAYNPFTIKARVVGPVNYLTTNYQQVAAWFGPDQNNFVKIEAEHNGSTGDPHLTLFFEQNGTGSTIATVSVPGLTTASTLDLVIKGNPSVADPTGDTTQNNEGKGYPFSQLTVSYSLNGATPVTVGTAQSPTDVSRWFSTAAKAGILVSHSGSTTPITATFGSLSISDS